jgi:hypothetical protein
MRVAILMMQKDEETLLEPWIVYHAYLFGISNLFVLDNGSTNHDVCRTLKKYSSLGLNVNYKHSTQEDYARKGEIVGETLIQVDKNLNHDIFIPLDCDEFVLLRNDDNSYSADKKEILDYLQIHINEPRVMRVEQNLANVLGSVGRYWAWKYQKTFYSASSFESMDHGYHTGSSRKASGYLPTRLVYAHYHFGPYKSTISKSKDKLSGRVDINDVAALAGFEGRGWHMAKYFLEGEDAYYKRFALPGAFDFFGLVNRFDSLGVCIPFASFILPPTSKE